MDPILEMNQAIAERLETIEKTYGSAINALDSVKTLASQVDTTFIANIASQAKHAVDSAAMPFATVKNMHPSIDYVQQISMVLAQYDFRISLAFQKGLTNAVGVESTGNDIDETIPRWRKQYAHHSHNTGNSIRLKQNNYRLVNFKQSKNPTNKPQEAPAAKESIRINHDDFIGVIDHFSSHPLIKVIGVATLIADAMERVGFDPHYVNSCFVTAVVTLVILYYSSSK